MALLDLQEDFFCDSKTPSFDRILVASDRAPHTFHQEARSSVREKVLISEFVTNFNPVTPYFYKTSSSIYPVKKNALYKVVFYPKIKALREDKETEPPKERIEADLRTLINPFLNDHLKTIFYGSYDEKQEAYSDIVSSYSPKDVLKEIVNYENEDDYDERLCYASKILRRMTEKDSFKALESFFEKHIRKNQEKYWIIKNFTSTICGFEFSDNSLNKKRIDFLKLIYNSYSPESEEGYSKEKMQEVFKKEIQSSLEDANTPLKKTF